MKNQEKKLIIIIMIIWLKITLAKTYLGVGGVYNRVLLMTWERGCYEAVKMQPKPEIYGKPEKT